MFRSKNESKKQKEDDQDISRQNTISSKGFEKHRFSRRATLAAKRVTVTHNSPKK